MVILPCRAYAGREIEKCAERRDNRYWKCDEWADDWYYKCPRWQPGKFVCYAIFGTVKWFSKAYCWSAHKVCVSWKYTKILRCVLYVSSNALQRLFGKILGFHTLAIPSPTSPFAPAIVYGGWWDREANYHVLDWDSGSPSGVFRTEAEVWTTPTLFFSFPYGPPSIYHKSRWWRGVTSRACIDLLQ